MLEVNLADPIWLEEGGFGDESSSATSYPRCAIGKFNAVVKNSSKDAYDLLASIIPSDKIIQIYKLNDLGLGNNLDAGQEKHFSAVRLLLNSLAESGKVKFVGTDIPELFEKVESKVEQAV